MKTFPTVEDYLEVIVGYRDPVTGKWSSAHGMIFGGTPIINLARYDVEVLNSMANTTANNDSLTQRQADLLCKIITKYRRQLANKNIDVTPVSEPQWRNPIRPMNYSRRVSVVGNDIQVKFPYDVTLIEEFRRFGKDSQGRSQWDRDQKVWVNDITEYNVSWIYTWATHHEFEVDAEVCKLFQTVQACERQPYAIELVWSLTGLDITNASDSLREYIQQHLGGFAEDNLLRLIDHSGPLGYTISEGIAQAVRAEYGVKFYSLLSNRELKVLPDGSVPAQDLDAILDYADTLQRWPVVCFEPDLFGAMLSKLRSRYPADMISANPAGLPTATEPRYIHTTKGIRNLNRIPLLITAAGLIFGGDRAMMIQNAEKIVYAAQDVYTKGQTNKKVRTIEG
jgi:hypothetical protein